MIAIKNILYSESLYVVNKCAGEEQSEEAEEVTSKKPIVWTRPEDFMIGATENVYRVTT